MINNICIRAPELVRLLNPLRKTDKMLGKPRILSNLQQGEHSCKIL